jgi:hypothetical protein
MYAIKIKKIILFLVSCVFQSIGYKLLITDLLISEESCLLFYLSKTNNFLSQNP